MGKSRLVWQDSAVKTTVQEINDPVSLTVFSQQHPYHTAQIACDI